MPRVNRGKTASLQKRPEPPSVDAMIKDIQATGGHDVLFDVMDPNSDEDFSFNDSSLVDNSLDQSALNAGDDGKEGKPSDTSVETTYTQVQRLLELQSSLLNASQELQNTYKQLQEQGANVSESLADFRQKAESLKK
ncbi:uncharacterized protein LOC135480080 [Liolophura sinensis]|uniref:uncharacterized protein LOC135480080 n=1 Tax=Liolophura sinensis TaxID=3198878 RepID=UPI003159088A